MRIRNARMRDAEAIVKLIPESIALDAKAISEKIQEDAAHIFVATDFSANILGCALSTEQVYVAENCCEAGVADELRKKY